MATRSVRAPYFQGQTGLTLKLYAWPMGIDLLGSAAVTESLNGMYDGELEDVDTGKYLALLTNSLDQTLAYGCLQHEDAVGGETVDDLDSILSAVHGEGSWAANNPILVVSASAPELASIDEDANINIHRGDYVAVAIIVGNIVGREGEKLYFTIRTEPPEDPEDDLLDEAAILQITEDSGAVRVNGGAWGTSTDGSITVVDEEVGTLMIVIKSAITTTFPTTSAYYDIQEDIGDGNSRTVARGRVYFTADVTRRTPVA